MRSTCKAPDPTWAIGGLHGDCKALAASLHERERTLPHRSDVEEVLRTASEKTKPGPSTLERREPPRPTRGKVGVKGLVAALVSVVGAAAFAVASCDQTPDAVPLGRPSVTGSSETSVPDATGATAPASAVGVVPRVDYVLDLDTGATTPLPESIGGRGENGYAISPDGSEVAYSGPAEDSSQQVFVAHLDGTHIRQITHDARATQPGWSPDGTKIAYVGRTTGDATRNIFVIDLTSEVTSETVDVSGTMFSPDGSSILYTAYLPDGSQVRTVPVTGGTASRLVGGHGSSAEDASFSPDGSLLSYTCDNGSQVLCVANADGSHARVIAGKVAVRQLPIGRSTRPIMTASWSPDGSQLAYWRFDRWDVCIVDVASGDRTRVGKGAWPRWLDNHTLIVEPYNGPQGPH